MQTEILSHTYPELSMASAILVFIYFIFCNMERKIDNCIEIYPYIIPFESIALSCLFEAFLVGMILINTKSSALDFD